MSKDKGRFPHSLLEAFAAAARTEHVRRMAGISAQRSPIEAVTRGVQEYIQTLAPIQSPCYTRLDRVVTTGWMN